MTLTEKWDKGELPEGDYYIKRRNGDFLYDNIDTSGVWRNSIDEDILEVLAPVPSYEEWQAKDKENAQLKELLKECKRYIDFWGYTDSHGNFLYPQIDKAIGEK